MKLTAQQVANICRSVGFRGDNLTIALATAYAESRFDAGQTHTNDNGTVDIGLFQVNKHYWPGFADWNLLDPAINARAAKVIVDDLGWGMWSTHTVHDDNHYSRYVAMFALWGDTPMETNPTVKAAVARHVQLLNKIAALAHLAGAKAGETPDANTVTLIGREIAAQPGGMCDRFARQIHELVMGLPDHGWQFAAASAAATEKLLKSHGRRLSGCVPGAVGLWDDGSVGHIVIYCGDGTVAENTSSYRGRPSRPGTKLTQLADVEAAHGGTPARWYFAGPVD